MSTRSVSVLLILLTTLYTADVASFTAVVSTINRHAKASTSHQRQQSSNSDTAENADSWLEKAAQLRKEADSMREKLGTDGSVSRQQVSPAKAVVTYTSLKDSVWTINYRFTNEPVSQDDNGKDDYKSNLVTSYGGKLCILLKPDGYTDMLSHEATTSKNLTAIKVWGWDVEFSANNDDGDDGKDKEYLLFSVDFDVPDSGKSRFYFQAYKKTDRDGVITFDDGTVTVKQDIGRTGSGGLFSLLSPKGILAQFRYVGNFVAKPATADAKE